MSRGTQKELPCPGHLFDRAQETGVAILPIASHDVQRFDQLRSYLGQVLDLHAASFLGLRCGLRKSEVAGLKGSDVDKVKGIVKVVGKGGRYREVADACRELEIDLTGIHRLRSNFAQNLVQDLQEQGLSEDQARGETSRQLGHNRLEVTRSYAP